MIELDDLSDESDQDEEDELFVNWCSLHNDTPAKYYNSQQNLYLCDKCYQQEEDKNFWISQLNTPKTFEQQLDRLIKGVHRIYAYVNDVKCIIVVKRNEITIHELPAVLQQIQRDEWLDDVKVDSQVLFETLGESEGRGVSGSSIYTSPAIPASHGNPTDPERNEVIRGTQNVPTNPLSAHASTQVTFPVEQAVNDASDRPLLPSSFIQQRNERFFSGKKPLQLKLSSRRYLYDRDIPQGLSELDLYVQGVLKQQTDGKIYFPNNEKIIKDYKNIQEREKSFEQNKEQLKNFKASFQHHLNINERNEIVWKETTEGLNLIIYVNNRGAFRLQNNIFNSQNFTISGQIFISMLPDIQDINSFIIQEKKMIDIIQQIRIKEKCIQWIEKTFVKVLIEQMKEGYNKQQLKFLFQSLINQTQQRLNRGRHTFSLFKKILSFFSFFKSHQKNNINNNQDVFNKFKVSNIPISNQEAKILYLLAKQHELCKIPKNNQIYHGVPVTTSNYYPYTTVTLRVAAFQNTQFITKNQQKTGKIFKREDNIVYVFWDDGEVNNYQLGSKGVEPELQYVNFGEELQLFYECNANNIMVGILYNVKDWNSQNHFQTEELQTQLENSEIYEDEDQEIHDINSSNEQNNIQFPYFSLNITQNVDWQRLLKTDPVCVQEQYIKNTLQCNFNIIYILQFYVFKCKETKYNKLILFNENYYFSKRFYKHFKIQEENIRNSFIPTFAGPPVSSENIRHPIVVCPGIDWHSGHKFFNPNCQYNKIGVALTDQTEEHKGIVYVLWISSIKDDVEKLLEMRNSLYKLTNDIIDNKQVNLHVYNHPIFKQSYQWIPYKAGKDRLFELSLYEFYVTIGNFQAYKLVGPSFYITDDYLLGLTICQADGWAIVFWGNGIFNRHRIGSGDVHELVYIDFM